MLLREIAGFKHMAVALESPFIPAQTIKIKMDCYAILTAAITTMVSALSAGKTALVSSVMMVHSATSQVHMVVVPVQFTSVTIVKKMACFGTPFAETTSTTLDVAYARPIVHLV